MRSPRRGPRVIAAALATVLAACQSASGPATADEARALLRAAIEAHGGRSALAQLDDVRIVSIGRFKGQLPFRRTLNYQAPDTWSMAIEFSGRDAMRFDGGTMRFGVAGDRCWRTERHLTALCSESDRRENARIAALQNARMLHRIDAADVQLAGTVD
jgi:hypothetical protein